MLKDKAMLSKKSRYIKVFWPFSLTLIILLSFLLSHTLVGQAQAQIKLRTVADWEAGSIVLLNGYKFVKLNGPGGDGHFMAMESICNIARDEDIIIEQTGEGTDENGFTLSVSNAVGMGPSCSWSAETADGTPVEANWTTIADPSNNRLTGCTIQIPKLNEETIFTPVVSNCNMSGNLSSSITVKTAPKTMTEVTDEYIAVMPTCEDETNCPAEATLELEDERDGKMYTVRKLADGNLWMVDNLAYGGTTTANGNIDACAGKTTFSGEGQVTPYVSWYQNDTQLYGDCVDPAVAPMSTAQARECGPGGTLDGDCGYLYNWQAAMQNPSAYIYGGTGINQNNVAGLCPTGWTLPTGDYSGQFQALQNASSWTEDQWADLTLFNGVYAGLTGSSAGMYNQYFTGNWWSSSVTSNSSAYYFHLSRSNIDTVINFGRSSGLSIRCIR